MKLFLPKTTFFHKWISFVIKMWFVFFLQLLPCRMSLIRCQIRIAVDNMLEFVHHASVRNKCDRIFQMHLSVCVSFFFKKQIHPWFCKEFHRHRMNLCCLHRDIPMLFDRITSRNISLERMTALMCHNIHISACSIEIGKNKRCAIFRKICHITAGLFCLSAEHIKEFILHHKIKELFCLR